MFRKDSVWLGILYAILLPAILFAIVYFPLIESGKRFSPKFFENLSLFLICANAVAMNWGFFQYERDQTGKGMFIMTGILAVAYIVYYVILGY